MSVFKSDKKWAIQNYAVWEQNVWRKFEIDKENSYLILSCSQLFIVSKSTILESLNFIGRCGDIESFYANGSIAIQIVEKTRNFKFKLRLSDGYNQKSSSENCLEVIKEFQKFIKVTQHPSHRGQVLEELGSKRCTEITRKLFQEQETNVVNAVESFMKHDNLKYSLQMFLLDPRSHVMINKMSQLYPCREFRKPKISTS